MLLHTEGGAIGSLSPLQIRSGRYHGRRILEAPAKKALGGIIVIVSLLLLQINMIRGHAIFHEAASSKNEGLVREIPEEVLRKRGHKVIFAMMYVPDSRPTDTKVPFWRI